MLKIKISTFVFLLSIFSSHNSFALGTLQCSVTSLTYDSSGQPTLHEGAPFSIDTSTGVGFVEGSIPQPENQVKKFTLDFAVSHGYLYVDTTVFSADGSPFTSFVFKVNENEVDIFGASTVYSSKALNAGKNTVQIHCS